MKRSGSEDVGRTRPTWRTRRAHERVAAGLCSVNIPTSGLVSEQGDRLCQHAVRFAPLPVLRGGLRNLKADGGPRREAIRLPAKEIKRPPFRP